MEYYRYYYFSSFRLKGVITNNMSRRYLEKAARSEEATSTREGDMLLNRGWHPAPSL